MGKSKRKRLNLSESSMQSNTPTTPQNNLTYNALHNANQALYGPPPVISSPGSIQTFHTFQPTMQNMYTSTPIHNLVQSNTHPIVTGQGYPVPTMSTNQLSSDDEWFLVVFPSLFTARAEDCDGLTQCMKNYGAQFQSIKLRADMTSDEGVYKFLDTICTPSNMDALVDCYSPQNMMGCAILSNVVKQIPSQETLRNQFTKVCSQKEELLETSKCILKEAVSTAIADCSIKIAQTSSDDQDKSALICSRMSSMMTCIESAMKGQCPEKTIEYVESSNKNQYTEFCSGSQIMINLLLVSFLLILIQLVN